MRRACPPHCPECEAQNRKGGSTFCCWCAGRRLHGSWWTIVLIIALIGFLAGLLAGCSDHSTPRPAPPSVPTPRPTPPPAPVPAPPPQATETLAIFHEVQLGPWPLDRCPRGTWTLDPCWSQRLDSALWTIVLRSRDTLATMRRLP
jgi:hypothetical protein